jgi:hypothetical protein
MKNAPEKKPPFDGRPEYYGKLGGKARAESLTPEQRKEIAKQAALARWRKWKDERKDGKTKNKIS